MRQTDPKVGPVVAYTGLAGSILLFVVIGAAYGFAAMVLVVLLVCCVGLWAAGMSAKDEDPPEPRVRHAGQVKPNSSVPPGRTPNPEPPRGGS